jgi:diacylglycerol kinase (ATP)
MSIRALLLHNPQAGRMPAYRLVMRAARIFERHGWRTEIHTVGASERAEDCARDAARDGLDVVVVAGGDGTLGQAAAGLAGSATALAVLPSGSANVWAQELRLPRLGWFDWLALDRAARALVHGRVHRIDVGWFNGEVFLLWAGVGLDAIVVRRREPARRGRRQFAMGTYFAEAVWSALDWHGVDLTARTESQEIRGHYLIAVVTNIHAYGGGLVTLAPDARVDDGWLDLWLFGGRSFAETLQRAWTLFTGRHLHDPNVQHMRFQSLRLEADTPAGLQLDGEPRRGSFPMEVHVWPSALNVLAPPDAPRSLFVDNVGRALPGA